MSMDRIKQLSGMKPPSPTEMSNKVMQRRDTDGDNALTIAESGLSEAKFNTIDADRDGLISEKEMVSKITQKMNEMKERMMNGGMGITSRGRMPDLQATQGLFGSNDEEDEDASADIQPSEFDKLLEIMHEMGTSMADSPSSAKDMYSMVLDQFDVDSQVQTDFFNLLESKNTSFLA